MTPSEYQQLVEFLGQRFAEIDGRFAQIDGRFGPVDSGFARMDRRFNELHDELAELRREMLGHFDEIYRRLERLEQEYQAITSPRRCGGSRQGWPTSAAVERSWSVTWRC
jgi:hypothetical protein